MAKLINAAKDMVLNWDDQTSSLSVGNIDGTYKGNIFTPSNIPDLQFVHWKKKGIVYCINPNKQYISSAPKYNLLGVSPIPRIFVSEKTRHILICFAKCGSSMLLNSLSNSEFGETRDMSWRLPQRIKDAVIPQIKDSESKIKSGEYTIVLVWRDPVDRFLSVCNMFPNNNWLRGCVIPDYHRMIQSHEDIIDWILFTQSFGTVDDSHITPQHLQFRICQEASPELKPNIIVNTKDLKHYLTSIGIKPIDSLPLHNSPIKKEELTEHQKELILKYAKEDFDLLKLAPIYNL